MAHKPMTAHSFIPVKVVAYGGGSVEGRVATQPNKLAGVAVHADSSSSAESFHRKRFFFRDAEFDGEPESGGDGGSGDPLLIGGITAGAVVVAGLVGMAFCRFRKKAKRPSM